MMENLENPLTNQPENITPPPVGISFLAKLKTKWPIVLGALGSIAIFVAIIYAVYSYGRRGQEVQPTPTVAPTPTSVVAVTPLLTTSLTPTTAVTPLITPILTPTAVTPTTPAVPFKGEGKIAFVRDGDIWVINPDGSREKKLVDINGYARELKWSNDGDRLVFVVTNTTGLASAHRIRDVYLYYIPDSGLRQLTSYPQDATSTYYYYYYPRFSPDGTKIAVNARAPDMGIIKVMSETEAVLQTINFDLFPKIPDSPTGSSAYAIFLDSVGWIDANRLVVSMRADTGYVSLWEFNLVNKQAKKIYLEFLDDGLIETKPALSPDGTKIAYIKKGDRGKNIWIIDSSGFNNRQLTNQPEDSPAGIFYDNPQFSPDGSKILATKGGSIVSIDPKNGTEQSLTSFYEFRGMSPGISGEQLVYVSLPTGSDPATVDGELWILNIETLEKHKLTTDASQPAWFPR